MSRLSDEADAMGLAQARREIRETGEIQSPELWGYGARLSAEREQWAARQRTGGPVEETTTIVRYADGREVTTTVRKVR